MGEDSALRVGILGCAAIATKNIRAISKAQEARIGMLLFMVAQNSTP